MKKNLIKWILGVCAVIFSVAGVSCSKDKVEYGADTSVEIQYFYEKLDGSYEKLITEAVAKEGETVEAVGAPLAGYVLDEQNPESKLSGNVKALL